jgi:hypothetical protein
MHGQNNIKIKNTIRMEEQTRNLPKETLSPKYSKTCYIRQ